MTKVYTKILGALLVAFLVGSQIVQAFPRTRATKHRRNQLSANDINALSPVDSATNYCEASEPCGWALYNQPRDHAASFRRRIRKYLQNTTCQCQIQERCLLITNRTDMRTYVFYCSEDSGPGQFEFPGTRK